MRVPVLTSSPDRFVHHGVFVIASLEADPEMESLAPHMNDANEKVRKLDSIWGAAKETSTKKLALRTRADYEADTLVREVDGLALVASKKKRDQSPYRDLFPKGVAAVIAAPLAQELIAMKTLEGNVAGVAALAAHAPKLAAAREKLDKAASPGLEDARAKVYDRADAMDPTPANVAKQTLRQLSLGRGRSCRLRADYDLDRGPLACHMALLGAIWLRRLGSSSRPGSFPLRSLSSNGGPRRRTGCHTRAPSRLQARGRIGDLRRRRTGRPEMRYQTRTSHGSAPGRCAWLGIPRRSRSA